MGQCKPPMVGTGHNDSPDVRVGKSHMPGYNLVR